MSETQDKRPLQTTPTARPVRRVHTEAAFTSERLNVLVRGFRHVFLLAALLFVEAVQADEAPRRIMETFADLGDVHRIFLAPGLASALQLPYPITEAKIGSPDQVQALISKTLPSELTLTLRTSSAQPTNLIVRCGSRTFVFDIIPSRRTHQDLIRISGAYGGPANQGAVLLDSSRTPPDDGRVLIDSSHGVSGRSQR